MCQAISAGILGSRYGSFRPVTNCNRHSTPTSLCPSCRSSSSLTMMTATDSVLSIDTNNVGVKQQRRQTVSAYPPPTPLDLVRVKAIYLQIIPYGY